ncbi:hypothetical protein [Nocardia sp. NBC_00403]|uniref:hypothetical protein n=1 Tax=Nocardia sp. NBC_00403 TaxID=2975990 RepID=UPI002E24B99D
MLLHSFAASSDPAIGPTVRERFGGIYRVIQELTDATIEEMRHFLGTGMLLTVMTAMGVTGPGSVHVQWAEDLLEDLRVNGD